MQDWGRSTEQVSALAVLFLCLLESRRWQGLSEGRGCLCKGRERKNFGGDPAAERGKGGGLICEYYLSLYVYSYILYPCV